MSASAAQAFASTPPSFADGLGDRHVCAETGTGELVQVLRVADVLTAVPSSEFAIRERAARLINVRHPSYARVCRVDRLQDGALAVVSEHVEGLRLSDLLLASGAGRVRIDTPAALALVSQLLPAVALFHEHARDAAHGLIAPERLIVTPEGRLVVGEHVFGSALEQLQFGRDRLWEQFRTAVPASAGGARIDHRADVNGIGITVLSLLLGRPLAPGEFPHSIPALLMQARERLSPGDERPLPNALRNWLARTLQLDVRRAFAAAPDALAAFEDALAGEPTLVPTPIALQALLSTLCRRTPQAAPPHEALHAAALATEQKRPVSAVDVDEVPSLNALIAIDDLADRRDAAGVEGAPGDDAGGDAPPTHVAAVVIAQPQSADAPAPRLSRWRVGWKPICAAAALLVTALGSWSVLGAGESSSGTLVVQSSPAGVDVFVDGVARGVTPAHLTLSAGSHILELRGRGVPRVIPLHVPAGGQISQYLEFADTPRTGMLVVHSDPAGATVFVDGAARGTAPLTIEGLQPGMREVVLRNGQGSSRHMVKVLAGTAASLVARVVTPGADGPVSGWVRITAPFTLEIYEDKRLIGTTDTERLMLAAGRHVLELVNGPLGYRESHTVQVNPGKTTTLAAELPTGRLDLNASPWAEVWIDGRSVGETPIGNLELPIGPYELVFRHPTLGERRHAVSVTTAAPVRVSVSMQ